MDEKTQQDDTSPTFRKWYTKNGDELNHRRRTRYQSDPEYREKAKASSRRTRTRRKERGGVVETTVIRVIDGAEVQLYRVSSAAEMIGKSPDTVRLWCRKGWIPERETGSQRLYQLHQIKLMRMLAAMLDKHRYSKDYQSILKVHIKKVHEGW